jgi:hypothetical protein
VYPDFLPKARELADEYLKLAWELEPALRQDPDFEEYGFFRYDAVTYQARLEKIYERQRREAELYNPVTGGGEPLFRTALQIVERIRQLAPFNQLDGSSMIARPLGGCSSTIFGMAAARQPWTPTHRVRAPAFRSPRRSHGSM